MKIKLVEVSENYPKNIEPVTFYPGRVSLSSWRGCNLKCRYCVLQMDPVDSDPFSAQRVSSVTELLQAYDALCASQQAARAVKILVNDHTDPFLTPEITRDTLAIIRGLATRGIAVPVVITTKLHPGEGVARELAGYAKEINLSIFVSIADIGAHARVDLNNIDDRFEALRHFSERGLHANLYIKPIGPWTDIEALMGYMHRYSRYLSEVVISPLKGTAQDYQKFGIVDAQAGFQFGEEIETALITRLKDDFPSLKISRKRSCAINRHHQLNCSPPAFGNGKPEETGDLFVNALVTDNYCEIRPESEFMAKPDFMRSLVQVAGIFDDAGVAWTLIGSLQRALRTGALLSLVNDIDIAVVKEDFHAISEVFLGFGMRPEVTMGCGNGCSRGSLIKNEMPNVIEIDRYRCNLRLDLSGVSIDVTTKPEEVIARSGYMQILGRKVMVAI